MKLVYYLTILFGIVRLNATLTLNKCQQKGTFALIFYGTPNSNNERILDILHQKKVKATFFYNSNTITNDNQKRICKRTFMQGHQIGLLASGLNDNEIEENLNNGQMELANIIQLKTNFIILNSLNSNLKFKNKLIEAGYNLINDIILFDKTQKESFDQIKYNELIQKEFQSFDSSKNSYVYSQSMISLDIPLFNEIINIIKVKKYKFVNLSECFNLSNPYQSLNPTNHIKFSSQNKPSQIPTLTEDSFNIKSDTKVKELRKLVKRGKSNDKKDKDKKDDRGNKDGNKDNNDYDKDNKHKSTNFYNLRFNESIIKNIRTPVHNNSQKDRKDIRIKDEDS